MEHITQKIKQKLINGERLTVVSVTNDGITTELRKYVSDLRKTMDIKADPVPRPGLKPYNVYYLAKTA